MEEEPKNTPAGDNWSEAIEDLVSADDTDGAIAALESFIASLESAGDLTSPESDSQLASALSDLAALYSSRGFTLKADRIRSRVALIRHRLLYSTSSSRVVAETPNEISKDDKSKSSSHVNIQKSTDSTSAVNENSDDDWEAIIDRSPDKLLSPQSFPGVSKLSLEDAEPKLPKRRGRGTFSYRKQELYSDHTSDSSIIDNVDDEDKDIGRGSESNREIQYSIFGTRHVLILADFAPSTKTIDLEKLFVDFKDHGFVIRWLNDTTALAVFGTPSLALEAKNRVICPFTVNVLGENDDILSLIPPKDLEPPRRRPKTSTRTAQRLIAQGMGLKLPTSFGSRELRKQEGDRRNRIVSRQKLKDDAWGED